MPAAPTITLDALRTLKSSQLQRLAVATGTATSGPKLALATRLLDALHHERLSPAPSIDARSSSRRLHASGAAAAPQRIVSLDMGVRNLAYCTLDLTRHTACATTGPGARLVPIVRTWRRHGILPASSASADADAPAFSLPTVARTAAALVRTLVLDGADGRTQPAAVLIERQRWRSGGGAAVQEWTLRVNTLEALLWGGLSVARAEGLWRLGGDPEAATGKGAYNAGIWGIDPGRVSRWWLAEPVENSIDGAKGEKKGKGQKRASLAAKANVKRRKIAVVADWLESGTHVDFEGEAAETRAAFLDKWKGTRKRSLQDHGESSDGVFKLDDLADCLLQAVAWLRWEENRRLVLVKGLAAADKLSA